MNLYGYDWPQGGTKQIAYVDGQSHMMELFVGFGDLWQSADLTVLTGAPPPNGSAFAGYAWPAGGTKQVVYRDQKSHIIELFVARGSPWQWVDLTALTGAPPPGDSALAGYAWSAGGTKQVVYRDQKSHIIELFVARGSPWQWVDLTVLTGAPPPGGSALVGYDWPNGQTKQVVYVDDQGHVIELYVARASPWQWVDLTVLTGAPPPNDSALAGYAWSAEGTKQVVYVDDQGHVIELFVDEGSPWRWVDLTVLTGAPPPSGPALAGYDWPNGQTKQVVYVDDQGHVIELFAARGSPWQWVDLTALTGAPLLHQKPLTGYAWVWGATKQVAYVDDHEHMIELHVGLSDQWRCSILTAFMRREAPRKPG